NFSEVVNVELSMDRMVNLPRGHGYIASKKRADAEKALLYMDGLRFTLKVASPMKALPPPKRDVAQIKKR
ncbi:hypothetical protein ACJX0J_039096, partial [Zea mays]